MKEVYEPTPGKLYHVNEWTVEYYGKDDEESWMYRYQYTGMCLKINDSKSYADKDHYDFLTTENKIETCNKRYCMFYEVE